MTARAFECPHCSGTFRVAETSSAKAVACPHCKKKVTVPASKSDDAAAAMPGGDAPPIEEPGAAPPVETAAPAGEMLPFDPFEVDAQEARSSVSRRGRRKSAAAQPIVRPLTRKERARRQRIRSTIVMLLCAAVLFGAVVLLSRR